MEGAIETITTFISSSSGDVHVVVSSNSTGDITHGANKCTTFQLSEDVLKCKTDVIFPFVTEDP